MFGFKKINIKAKNIRAGDKLLFNNDEFPVNNFVKRKNNYILTLDKSKIIKQNKSFMIRKINVEESEQYITIIRRKNIIDYIFGLKYK
jgi:hypothetical protein